MILGPGTPVPIEAAAPAAPLRSTRSWRILDTERRLAAVEQALRPTCDCIDGFPPAL